MHVERDTAPRVFSRGPHSRLAHIWQSRLRWLRGAPLARYGDHVSGLDHSEPVWRGKRKTRHQ